MPLSNKNCQFAFFFFYIFPAQISIHSQCLQNHEFVEISGFLLVDLTAETRLNAWDVCDFLLLFYFFNLCAQISGRRFFSDLLLCSNQDHSSGRHKAALAFPQGNNAQVGAGSRGMNPFYLLLLGFWCQHQSPFTVSPVPDVFLGTPHRVWVESCPRQSLLHWEQQDQQLRQCSVFVGEGKLSCRSWSISVYWSILGHPMFSLGFLFSPHRTRIPFHAASLHSPELWCWQLHLFCCLLLPTL